jgi:hypothetical protein
MSRIDRALVSIDWELSFPNSVLQAFSSSASDHAPLHLSMNTKHNPRRRFRFELSWLKLDGFDEAVKEGWLEAPRSENPGCSGGWMNALGTWKHTCRLGEMPKWGT